MKTSKNLIGIGALLLIFGGMGLDGAESKVAYILVAIGLVLMGIGAKHMKSALMVLAFSVFMMFPAMEVNAQSEQILSDEIIGYCEEIGEQYGICSELLQAMIERESTGNPKAENGSCKGLMQVSVKYHKDRMEKLGVEDIFDPYGNILVGADYLSELFNENEDVGLVLMIYNGTSDAKERAERGEYTSYVEKILDRSAELERLHGK